MNIVEFRSVWKFYDQKPVIRNISLTIQENERLVILGPSGCGKTTLLRLLAGFITPEKGDILINTELVASDGTSLKEPRDRNLGMVFQDLALWPHMTVRDNLEFGLKAQGIKPESRERRIRETLRLTQMEGYAQVRPGRLSGGQQQRVALGRALVLRPKALLMDEPLSSLDLQLKTRIQREILKLHREIGFTLIYVTHDEREAAEIGKRMVVMKNGEIERIGPTHPRC